MVIIGKLSSDYKNIGGKLSCEGVFEKVNKVIIYSSHQIFS